MTIQALVAFLVAFPRRRSPKGPEVGNGLPSWELHPSQQQYLREKAREDLRLWARIPRSW
jgi:hypothetical protein